MRRFSALASLDPFAARNTLSATVIAPPPLILMIPIADMAPPVAIAAIVSVKEAAPRQLDKKL